MASALVSNMLSDSMAGRLQRFMGSAGLPGTSKFFGINRQFRAFARYEHKIAWIGVGSVEIRDHRFATSCARNSDPH